MTHHKKRVEHPLEFLYMALGAVALVLLFLPWSKDITFGWNLSYVLFATARVVALLVVSYYLNKRIIRAVVKSINKR